MIFNVVYNIKMSGIIKKGINASFFGRGHGVEHINVVEREELCAKMHSCFIL